LWDVDSFGPEALPNRQRNAGSRSGLRRFLPRDLWQVLIATLILLVARAGVTALMSGGDEKPPPKRPLLEALPPVVENGETEADAVSGGLVVSARYDVVLPTAPNPGQVLETPINQQLGPDQADRFAFRLGLGDAIEDVLGEIFVCTDVPPAPVRRALGFRGARSPELDQALAAIRQG
jgi:hypothetical protein